MALPRRPHQRREADQDQPVGGLAPEQLGHRARGDNQEQEGEDPGFDPRRNGLDHLAFTLADRLDMDAWAARLSEHGVGYDGPFDIPPGAILNFKDPDGIALSLFWDR